jgi:hypothetical protein
MAHVSFHMFSKFQIIIAVVDYTKLVEEHFCMLVCQVSLCLGDGLRSWNWNQCSEYACTATQSSSVKAFGL